jgi:hypothetical protein
VKSEVRKCERGRRVVLFKQRPGADRKLGAALSAYSGGGDAKWGVDLRPAQNVHWGDRLYAEVKRKGAQVGRCVLRRPLGDIPLAPIPRLRWHVAPLARN